MLLIVRNMLIVLMGGDYSAAVGSRYMRDVCNFTVALNIDGATHIAEGLILVFFG